LSITLQRRPIPDDGSRPCRSGWTCCRRTAPAGRIRGHSALHASLARRNVEAVAAQELIPVPAAQSDVGYGVSLSGSWRSPQIKKRYEPSDCFGCVVGQVGIHRAGCLSKAACICLWPSPSTRRATILWCLVAPGAGHSALAAAWAAALCVRLARTGDPQDAGRDRRWIGPGRGRGGGAVLRLGGPVVRSRELPWLCPNVVPGDGVLAVPRARPAPRPAVARRGATAGGLRPHLRRSPGRC
jgi:hypothetical protein